MDGRIDEIAATVAAVTQAAGTALDPSTILARTFTALAPAVEVAGARLWLGDGDDLHLAATTPQEQVAMPPEAHLVALMGVDRAIGQLAIAPLPGRTFGTGERALLEIAAGQIAGALERARLFQEVMELERLKSDFIARVSHELRTPITIIKGFLDTMLAHEHTLGPEQRHHMLERSHLASSRLSGLIEELLILSRLEAGVLTPAPAPVAIAGVLADVRQAALEPERVTIDTAAGATLTTDGTLLTRALGLVVDNAIKYGGAAVVTAVAPSGSGSWAFEVRDHGPGFPADVRDTAFEMFTRAQGTTAIPGLGVGLPIARTLVEVLDGEIAIDGTHPGPGALVRILLPAST